MKKFTRRLFVTQDGEGGYLAWEDSDEAIDYAAENNGQVAVYSMESVNKPCIVRSLE